MRLVFGLGRSGLGVLRFLSRRGERAAFYDDRPKREELELARALGHVPDPDPRPGRYREVIAAPGVPLGHPRLQALKAPVIGEAELAYREGRAEILGVTGTAGKTSTTHYLAHVLRAAGVRAEPGGNTGTPLVDVVDRAEVAVAELSSFQLERIARFRPRVAVLLNLGVDHLDRHGSLEAYHRAKLRILENLTPEDAVVYHAGDPRIAHAVAGVPAKTYPFFPGPDADQANREAARLAAKAYLELKGLPYDPARLAEAAQNAPGVPGRFEAFHRHGRIVFIDDSIATRTLAVEAALRRAPAPVAWILGGLDKGAEPERLRPLVEAKVAVILAIGNDGERLARPFADAVPVVVIREQGKAALVRAVSEALAWIEEGSVLLAPMAASFDMFPNYQARSRAFREAVEEVLWTPSSS